MDWSDYVALDTDTWELYWLERPLEMFANRRVGASWNTSHAGKKAGGICKLRGYVVVRIWNKTYQGHRIIWEMLEGAISKGEEIDHINRIKHDNRRVNLRSVKYGQNVTNRKPTSIVPGVTKAMSRGQKWNGKWLAQITVGYKNINLGRYNTRGEAAVAYAKATLRHFGKHSHIYSSRVLGRQATSCVA